MPKLVDHEKVKQEIINGTLQVAVEKGLDGITTKTVAAYSKCNEAYIYRYFKGVSDLSLQVFRVCDEKLINILHDNLYYFNVDKNFREAFNDYFNAIWDNLSGNSPYANYYFYYYHSKAFINSAIGMHRALLDDLFVKVRPYFKREVNTEVTLNLVLIGLIGSALLVNEGLVANSKETRAIICDSLYQIIYPKLDDSILNNRFNH